MSTGENDPTWVDGSGDETSLDQGADETSIDGGADTTTVDGGSNPIPIDGGTADDDGGSIYSLPGSLRSRYTQLRVLERGSQGIPFVVQDGESGERRLIKVHDRPPGEEYERILTTVMDGETMHLVGIHDFGTDGRHFWEIQEYCEGGSLAELIASGRLVTDRQMFDAVIAEVSTSIAYLHSLGKADSRERWVHRDIKPANVLIRTLEPLDLVLCDFGLTKVIEGSQAKASASATALYAAPEVFGQYSLTSPARDWWAFGMMVIEMATGSHPFVADNGVAFSPYEIQKYVVTKRVDTSGIQDARLRSLAQGLLVRDPDNRWNGEQIEAWLRGEDPPIDDAEAPAMPIESAHQPRPGTIPFDFPDPATGEEIPYRSPTLLAAAMAHEDYWDHACAVIVGGQKTRAAHRSLREFVESAGLSDDYEEQALKQLTTQEGSAHRRLLRFLQALDPTLPAGYRGVPLEPQALAALASQAVSEAGDADTNNRDIVLAMFEDRPMRLFTDVPESEQLLDLERRWHRLVGEAVDSIEVLAETMRAGGDASTREAVQSNDELRRRAICLALLLTADESSRDQLLGELRGLRGGDAGQVGTWAEVADRALSGSKA